MKDILFISALLAFGPSVALAAKAYIPCAYNASIPEIHNKPITANNGFFYVNKPTTAVCPTYDPSCPSQNTTIVSGPTYGQQWWMGILEAGGQQIFAENIGRGPIGYAAADSSNYLPYYSSYAYLFSFSNDTVDGKPTLSVGTEGFSVCDDGNGTYSLSGYDIYTTTSKCQPIQVVLEETDAAAVQYYACTGCETRCNSRYGCSTATPSGTL